MRNASQCILWPPLDGAKMKKIDGAKMKKRTGYNPKRRLAEANALSLEKLTKLAEEAGYGGNPEHKSKPADFCLVPATNPRPGKTLCDKVRDFTKAEALGLVRAGFKRGMVSVQFRGAWPQNVWSVLEDEVFEAQLENFEFGVYHGYPMPSDDDFRHLILREWRCRE
jgi:hypothetical protein